MRIQPLFLFVSFFLGSSGICPAHAEESFNGKPVLEWSRDLPGGKAGGLFHTERAAPAVHNGLLYVGSAGGSALYSLDLNSGGLNHSYPTESAVFSSPLFQEDGIYFSDSAGYTYRFEIGESEPTWKHFGGVPIGATPTLHGDTLFVATVDDLVFAIDKNTGETHWRYQHPPDATRQSELTLFGAPSPVAQGAEVFFGFSDGSLAALDVETGQVNWERQVGQGRYPDLIATPVVADGDIYLGAFSEPFLALDRQSHNPRWSLDLGTAAAVAVSGDRLYVGGSDGQLRSVDRKTGEVVWSWDSDTSGALTAPQLTQVGIVVASSDGGLYIVNAKTGRLNWTYKPDHHLAGISATPMVFGDRLVATTNGGQLLSFRTVKTSTPPESWRKWDLF
jgi:outer membrane protein assembly factor BamB